MNLIPIRICNRKDAPSPIAFHEYGKRGHTSGYDKVFLNAYLKVYVFLNCNTEKDVLFEYNYEKWVGRGKVLWWRNFLKCWERGGCTGGETEKDNFLPRNSKKGWRLSDSNLEMES